MIQRMNLTDRRGRRRRPGWQSALALGVASMAALAACGSSGSSSSSTEAPAASEAPVTTAAPDSGAPATEAPAMTEAPVTGSLRLGYFPNITHATALVGLANGIFADKLGSGVKLETQTFNAGGDASNALLSDAIDMTFIGPNPSINAYVKSKGQYVIISGAASGGAALVVKPDINSAADLKGKKLATPQLGNTQDVALRAWLKDNGLNTDTAGGGDVSIVPQENAATLLTFINGDIEGAWLPEPWASRLVQDGGAKVLVDEATLWPEGKFVTTDIVASKKYVDEHPDIVKRFLEGVVASNDFIATNPEEAQKAANGEIERITSKPLKDALIGAAWKNLTFTNDPVASSLQTSADHATELGLLDKVDNLSGIYDLTLLNQVLAAAGQPEVEGLPEG
jgi:NitT/TauT family transport system substrate-binding protein